MYQKVDLAKQSRVVMDLPVRKVESLRLDFGKNPGKMFVENIVLNGKKKLRLESFEGAVFANVSEKSTTGGVLTIVSEHRDPYMIFPKSFVAKAKMPKIDWHIAVIVLTLSFVLFYKLVQYLADFKLRDHYSRIDIVFVCAFFVILFIPMSRINYDDVSKQENRRLALFKPLYADKGMNFDFGRGIERWFNDRFLGREKLIKNYALLKDKLSNKIANGAIYMGKDNWIFNINEKPFMDISDETKGKYVEQVGKLVEFCRKNNIKLYFLVLPMKESLYREYGNAKFVDKQDFVVSIKEHLDKETGFKMTYIQDEMMQAKEKDFVFFKTDHHWTDWGAFVGYQTLMREIGKDFANLPVLQEEDHNYFYNNQVKAERKREFTNGHTYKLLNIDDESILDTPYRYFKNKDETAVVLGDIEISGVQDCSSKKGKKRALLIGNSMMENFIQFFAYSFAETRKIRANLPRRVGGDLNMQNYEEDILDFKPDVLVFVFNSSYTNELLNLF